MDYATHYRRLVERARSRVLPAHVERHHVIPTCMGGTNEPENIVALTPEEHYVAHQLLVKINPTVRGLAVATILMAPRCGGNKAYGWLRRRHARDVSKRMIGNQYSKGNSYWVGRKHSDAARAKQSAAKRGKKRKPRTDEEKQKTRLGNIRTKSSLANYNSAFLSDPAYKRAASIRMKHIWALRKSGELPSPVHKVSPARR